MPNTNTNPTYLTLKEAAKIADREIDTIRKWITKGKLVATRKRPENKRSAYLIKEVDLLAYMSANLESKTLPTQSVSNTEEQLGLTSHAHIEVLVLKERIAGKEESLRYERQLVSNTHAQLEDTKRLLQEEKQRYQQARTDLEVSKDIIKELREEIKELRQRGFLERLFSFGKGQLTDKSKGK
jgi:hypothetical protein